MKTVVVSALAFAVLVLITLWSARRSFRRPLQPWNLEDGWEPENDTPPSKWDPPGPVGFVGLLVLGLSLGGCGTLQKVRELSPSQKYEIVSNGYTGALQTALALGKAGAFKPKSVTAQRIEAARKIAQAFVLQMKDAVASGKPPTVTDSLFDQAQKALATFKAVLDAAQQEATDGNPGGGVPGGGTSGRLGEGHGDHPDRAQREARLDRGGGPVARGSAREGGPGLAGLPELVTA
jgi:hypothetical protein